MFGIPTLISCEVVASSGISEAGYVNAGLAKVGIITVGTGATSANIMLVQDRDTGQPRRFGFVEINNDKKLGAL